MKELLYNFYTNSAIYINRIIIVLYICLIYYVYKNKIRGYKYSVAVLVVVGIAILFGWYLGVHKVTSFRKKSCLINNKVGKSSNTSGIFFNSCLDFWHLTHLLMWILIGIMTPNKYILVLMIGILWEFVEHRQFSNDGSCTSPVCWRIEDIFINMVGYAIGSMISRY
jgi:hypothetical protein